ncbi:endogenous retroviral envelope protein HEMO-like [Pelodiscus sinensis]|uniref:endogenous retroviral envelope protein HEMO-like n=1 Tax=Pelodiscus sinensis TaxID=13735 RepID=UPI003F6D46B0
MGLYRLIALVPTPQEIQSDNGSHFKNKLVNEWALRNGVQWTFHLPYRPQSNGMVERWNGLLKAHLRPTDGKWGNRLDTVVQRLNNRQTPTGSPISKGFFPTERISPSPTVPLKDSKYAPGDTVVIKHPSLGTQTRVLHSYKGKGVWTTADAGLTPITITEAWIVSKTGEPYVLSQETEAMVPNSAPVGCIPPNACLESESHYELCIYILLAVVMFAITISYRLLKQDVALPLAMGLLFIPTATAVPEHPLKSAIQTIASAAAATDCWMCTLLDSSTGLEIEFVPLSPNDWWNKSDIFRWGPVWFDGSDYRSPQNDSGGRLKGWHWTWRRTVWSNPVEYVTGNSKEMYPVCFESKEGSGPQLGSFEDHQCTHIATFNKKLGAWDIYSDQDTHQGTLNCWGNVINVSLGHRPLFGISNAAIIPLNFSQYQESSAWYNNSLFIVPSTGYIYNPTLVNGSSLLPDQCAKADLLPPDQILQDLLFALQCSVTNSNYCAAYHAPKKRHTRKGWYKGPYSPILNKGPGLFFICRTKAYKYLPVGWIGRCSLRHAVPGGLTVHPHITAPSITNLGSFLHRYKRKFTINPLVRRPTGFHRFTHAFLPWLGVAELEQAIVNVSGQLEIAFNHTADALGLLNEQIQSVARFALQNRIALDAILAQQGGVCAVINQSCCFYVNHSGQIEQDVSAIKDAVKILHAVAKDGEISWLNWLAQHLGLSLIPFLHSILITVLTIVIVIIIFCITLCIVKRLVNVAISSVHIRYAALGKDPGQFLDYEPLNQTIGHF